MRNRSSSGGTSGGATFGAGTASITKATGKTDASGKTDAAGAPDMAGVACTADAAGAAHAAGVVRAIRPAWVASAVGIDTVGVSSTGVVSQMNRQNRIAATQDLTQWALNYVLENDLDPVGCCEEWSARLADCGTWISLKKCGCRESHDGDCRARTWCCHVPLCTRFQRNHAVRFSSRANALMDKYRGDRVIRPKLVTLTRRHQAGESMSCLVEKMVRVRANFARWARKNFGMVAGFGCLELSQGNHVHLHFIIWSKFIPRDLLVSWLRSQDCTIPHCTHPADDRCSECTETNCECRHLDGDRVRCNGSYMASISICYDVTEAIKYAAKPVIIEDPKAAWQEEQMAWAVDTVLFFVHSYRRHRIETYGEAREGTPDETGDVDDVVDDAVVARCSQGSAFNTVVVGRRVIRGYTWKHSSVDPPPPQRKPLPSAKRWKEAMARLGEPPPPPRSTREPLYGATWSGKPAPL